ncbi:hypothetical protein [Brumimicrobium mesophilum]|uniref:hypothetical protein n=1 Tax=Brumimicrobium mesophilum TaxID=392717 RepID=UPI000D140899|nr:hypothetical protein [Brumimicrobium mesophilum]
MARNKLEDLRDHLFAQMERLNDESLTPEQIAQEGSRAKSIAMISSSIVDTAKIEVRYLELNKETEIESRSQLFKEVNPETPAEKLKRLDYVG